LANGPVEFTDYVQAVRARIMTEQLAVQKRQIADLERTRSRQELRSVTRDLLDIQADIEVVLALEGKDHSEWTEEDSRAAHTVCARLHLVGILILEEMVPEDLFAKAWVLQRSEMPCDTETVHQSNQERTRLPILECL
jgi:hypothetical protein